MNWTICGKALGKGGPGDWDEKSVRRPSERRALWSEDGVHFVKAGAFDNKPTGFYCPENFGNGVNNRGASWGLDVTQNSRPVISSDSTVTCLLSHQMSG